MSVLFRWCCPALRCVRTWRPAGAAAALCRAHAAGNGLIPGTRRGSGAWRARAACTLERARDPPGFLTLRGRPVESAWVNMAIDVLVLVPFEPASGALLDPVIRRTQIAHFSGPMKQAFHELEALVGRPLSLSDPAASPRYGAEVWPSVSGRQAATSVHRSLSAVSLATHLELAGLNWAIVDPGAQELSYWAAKLAGYRSLRPRCVAVCSTFVTHEPWIRTLCAIIRETPAGHLALLVGGLLLLGQREEVPLARRGRVLHRRGGGAAAADRRGPAGRAPARRHPGAVPASAGRGPPVDGPVRAALPGGAALRRLRAQHADRPAHPGGGARAPPRSRPSAAASSSASSATTGRSRSPT